MSTVSSFLPCFSLWQAHSSFAPPATSTLLITGSADNSLKLWRVQTGECLHTWEFPTAVKRVNFSEDDSKVLAVTEQRMGHMGAIRVFNINREGPRESIRCPSVLL